MFASLINCTRLSHVYMYTISHVYMYTNFYFIECVMFDYNLNVYCLILKDNIIQCHLV
jgi:hypothetical protein